MIPGYRIGEAIFRSRTRAVWRAARESDGLPVIIKTIDAEYPSRRQVAVLRREFRILERLQQVPGVIRAYALQAWGNGNSALVLEPFGRSLALWTAQFPGHRVPLARFLDLAIALVEILGRVHDLDIVHKRLEKQTILIDDAGNLRLINFAIASELSQEPQGDAAERRLEGAPAYMSPEQTGRMNRDVDYTSDYYSLGVTFYELLTGELPFAADSVLEWVHCHISKQPQPPHERVPSIPAAVSAILMKLMAKNAEDRYQSSWGLVADLDRCRRELAQTGAVSSFALAHHDVPRRFRVPQKLYGREAELAALGAIFDQAAAGGTELCMVSGTSGVGKSALVNELARTLARQQGYLAQGKFDQFQRATPYAAATAALRHLVRQLLAESDERREQWRRRFAAALGPNTRVIAELAPELERIVGAAPPVPELPRAEAQNRFQIALLDFLRAVTAEQPLVIFIDDLQYSDASTLNLIGWIAAARDLPRLLLIGAYRSNEVDAGHPLRLALNEIGQGRPIHELVVKSLEIDAVQALLADALHADDADCRPLAEVLNERVQGNPFFLGEMLRALEQSSAIAFSPAAGRWRWDLDAVRRSELGTNVVEFVVGNLRKLPEPTQRALQLAACIGASFDLRLLATIAEQPMDAVGESLLPALQRHMILPLAGDYRFAGLAADDEVNPGYRFHHDRIQQAAYALIDEDRRAPVHLSVGRLMQRYAASRDDDERLIDIVGHLNEGRRLITDPAERLSLARLNLAAGIRAQRSSAYESARGYLAVGQELLPADAWVAQYELAMALATEYQQCAYLTGRVDEAEAWIETMLARATSDLARAEILANRTRQYSTTGKMVESIRAAIQGLALLGVRFTDDPDAEAIRRERRAVQRNLHGRRIAELVDAPPMTDPARQVAIRLLMEIFPAAFLSGSGNLFPFLVLKAVNLSLRYGTSPESAFAYAAYGMLLCGTLDDPSLGLEYGTLAVAMNDRLDDIALKSRVIYVYAMFVHHWSHHWSTMTPWFRRGIESGYQSGDLLYLAYNAQDCIIWDPKLDLDAAEREHAGHMEVVRDTGYRDSFDSGSLFLQMMRNFLGRTDAPLSMNDAGFDEAQVVEGMRRRRFMTGVANHHIYKAEICWLHGAPDEALAHVRAMDALRASAMSLPQLVRFIIVAFLVRGACLPRLTADEADRERAWMDADFGRMRRWAKHCPENFLHLALLMEAELARLAGRVDAALRLYERAADQARQGQWRRDEAMANELAARLLLGAGRRKAAEGYLLAARALYDSWGAARKVALLDEEFRQHLRGLPARGESPDGAEAAVEPELLDLASVMKASQAISGELLLEQLWATTMRIMLENAGGQRGAFVVRRDGHLLIEGLCEVGADAPNGALAADATAPRSLALDAAASALPVTIVYQVLNTQAPLVLADARRSEHAARDAYLRANAPQSLLCLPLVRQGKFEGAIYMENRAASGVFTAARIEVIKLLAAQMSVSIENAQLYEAQQRLIAAQRRFVPREFLESLDQPDIARVDPGEHIAKTMSVLFSDLRGFTPVAERLPARDVIGLLNGYFGAMGPAITAAGGFIDSFAGDEIKALFDTGADAAVAGGIAMWRALDAFNERSRALGQPELNMGVGVNTGPVVLGTVSAGERMQCSVIGDTVNLASRIEALTKLYKARLLIGEGTFRALAAPDRFTLRQVDRVAVKGKDVAIALHEVIDADPPGRQAAKLATRERLGQAMQHYVGRDFATAQRAFERLCAEDPDDAVPPLYVERCSRYASLSLPPDWLGVERLTQK
jgi:predicted ATPase/class 3 adenylate cyclase